MLPESDPDPCFEEVPGRVPDLEDAREPTLLARPDDPLSRPREPEPHGRGPLRRDVGDAEGEPDLPRRLRQRVLAELAGTARHQCEEVDGVVTRNALLLSEVAGDGGPAPGTYAADGSLRSRARPLAEAEEAEVL
jgi:hypothetical protein